VRKKIGSVMLNMAVLMTVWLVLHGILVSVTMALEG
jgi:hypothetical protein